MEDMEEKMTLWSQILKDGGKETVEAYHNLPLATREAFPSLAFDVLQRVHTHHDNSILKRLYKEAIPQSVKEQDPGHMSFVIVQQLPLLYAWVPLALREHNWRLVDAAVTIHKQSSLLYYMNVFDMHTLREENDEFVLQHMPPMMLQCLTYFWGQSFLQLTGHYRLQDVQRGRGYTDVPEPVLPSETLDAWVQTNSLCTINIWYPLIPPTARATRLDLAFAFVRSEIKFTNWAYEVPPALTEAHEDLALACVHTDFLVYCKLSLATRERWRSVAEVVLSQPYELDLQLQYVPPVWLDDEALLRLAVETTPSNYYYVPSKENHPALAELVTTLQPLAYRWVPLSLQMHHWDMAYKCVLANAACYTMIPAEMTSVHYKMPRAEFTRAMDLAVMACAQPWVRHLVFTSFHQCIIRPFPAMTYESWNYFIWDPMSPAMRKQVLLYAYENPRYHIIFRLYSKLPRAQTLSAGRADVVQSLRAWESDIFDSIQSHLHPPWDEDQIELEDSIRLICILLNKIALWGRLLQQQQQPHYPFDEFRNAAYNLLGHSVLRQFIYKFCASRTTTTPLHIAASVCVMVESIRAQPNLRQRHLLHQIDECSAEFEDTAGSTPQQYRDPTPWIQRVQAYFQQTVTLEEEGPLLCDMEDPLWQH